MEEDREDMMGHYRGLQKQYERYEELDFERFPEYQKAIPLLTIDDAERLTIENRLKDEKIKQYDEDIARQMAQLQDEVRGLSESKKDETKTKLSEEKKEKILKLLADNNLL